VSASVYMNMNRKQTRTPLKVEFKQFQRLPHWPVGAASMDPDRPGQNATLAKVEMAALLMRDNTLGIRSLAE